MCTRRWISDRLYEAGVEDTILLPVRILGSDHALTLTPVQGAQWALAALYALALAGGIWKAGGERFAAFNEDLDNLMETATPGMDPTEGFQSAFDKAVGTAGTTDPGATGNVFDLLMVGAADPRRLFKFLYGCHV